MDKRQKAYSLKLIDMQKFLFRILKWVTFFFWRQYMKRVPVPHPPGIPYERDPDAKCEFYEPFKRRKWYFDDCETDGHYLCAKCIHNAKHKNPDHATVHE